MQTTAVTAGVVHVRNFNFTKNNKYVRLLGADGVYRAAVLSTAVNRARFEPV